MFKRSAYIHFYLLKQKIAFLRQFDFNKAFTFLLVRLQKDFIFLFMFQQYNNIKHLAQYLLNLCTIYKQMEKILLIFYAAFVFNGLFKFNS